MLLTNGKYQAEGGDVSTDLNVTAQQRNIKTMKIQPTSGEPMTPPAWCPTGQGVVLWTCMGMADLHNIPHSLASQHRGGQAFNNSHPRSFPLTSKPLPKNLLSIVSQQTAEGPAMTSALGPRAPAAHRQAAETAPGAGSVPSPLLENRLALIFTRCVHFTLSEIRSTEIFYPTYVTINGTY